MKEEDKDIKETLSKLPTHHRKLVQGYKIIFEPDSTLKNDDKHVGVITSKPKEIRVASPWNYGRGFAFLHEIGHLVWEKFIKGKKEKEWSGLCKKVKDKKKGEPEEELFCHAYASTYCKYPPKLHHHESWERFIKTL